MAKSRTTAKTSSTGSALSALKEKKVRVYGPERREKKLLRDRVRAQKRRALEKETSANLKRDYDNLVTENKLLREEIERLNGVVKSQSEMMAIQAANVTQLQAQQPPLSQFNFRGLFAPPVLSEPVASLEGDSLREAAYFYPI